MTDWKLVVGLVLVAFAGGLLLARELLGDRLPRAEVTELLAARDSAIAVLRSERELERELSSELRRQVDSLEANPEVVARIEIRRDTIRVTDTIPGEVLQPAGEDALATDTVEVRLPVVQEDGITARETLRVSPPLHFLERELELAFDPDTLALALVRDPLGLARIVSSIEREGIDTRTLFAAELNQEPSALSKVYDVLQPISCVVAGFAAAERWQWVGGTAGATCLAGVVF